jgi:hypothetical protein
MEAAMRDTRLTVKLACFMALALGTTAAAQQRTVPAPEERGDLDAIRRVSTLIGTPVVDRADTKVAHLRDLLLSPGGDVLYVVLGCGGVGGVGESYTAAPVNALAIRPADGKWDVRLDMTADDLKKAPAIKSENYREFNDPQWVARVHRFFRAEEPAQARTDEVSRPAARPPGVEWVILATKVLGSRLRNPQDEDLGKIEDLLLNRMHRVAFLIIGRGGVLSIGEHYIAVPWSRTGLSTNPATAAVTVSIDATKAQIEKAPLVKGENYATLLDHGFADQVRHYFETLGHQATTGTRGERR